jgi:hypothetical protein
MKFYTLKCNGIHYIYTILLVVIKRNENLVCWMLTQLNFALHELFTDEDLDIDLDLDPTIRKVACSSPDVIIGFFLICLILPAVLWYRVDLPSNRNEYQEIFWE